MLLGGRTAEEVVFGEPTTGAADDIERATAIARSMVTEWGMSDLIGPLQVARRDGEVFLGREMGRTDGEHSGALAQQIDAEVRRIVDGAHRTAEQLLTEHRTALDAIASALIERETVDADEFLRLVGVAS
jgi:cell division protease FtsH